MEQNREVSETGSDSVKKEFANRDAFKSNGQIASVLCVPLRNHFPGPLAKKRIRCRQKKKHEYSGRGVSGKRFLEAQNIHFMNSEIRIRSLERELDQLKSEIDKLTSWPRMENKVRGVLSALIRAEIDIKPSVIRKAFKVGARNEEEMQSVLRLTNVINNELSRSKKRHKDEKYKLGSISISSSMYLAQGQL
jgi:hypothetical protein